MFLHRQSSRNKTSADRRNESSVAISFGVHMWEEAFPVFERNVGVLTKLDTSIIAAT